MARLTPDQAASQNDAAGEAQAITRLTQSIDEFLPKFRGQPLEEQIFGRYSQSVWAKVQADFRRDGWSITPGNESRSTTNITISKA